MEKPCYDDIPCPPIEYIVLCKPEKIHYRLDGACYCLTLLGKTGVQVSREDTSSRPIPLTTLTVDGVPANDSRLARHLTALYMNMREH